MKTFVVTFGDAPSDDIIYSEKSILAANGCNVDELFDMLVRQFVVPKIVTHGNSIGIDIMCTSIRKCAEKRIRHAKDIKNFTSYMYALAMTAAYGYKFGSTYHADVNDHQGLMLFAYQEITTRFNRDTYLLLLLSEYVSTWAPSRSFCLTHKDVLADLLAVLHNNRDNDDLATVNHSYTTTDRRINHISKEPRTLKESIDATLLFFAKLLAPTIPEKFIDTIDDTDYVTGEEIRHIIFMPIFMPGDELPHNCNSTKQIIYDSKHNMFTGEPTTVAEISAYNEKPEIMQRRKEYIKEFNAWATIVLQELTSVAV